MGKEESSIQKACLDYLQHRGFFAWRSNNQGTYIKSRDAYAFHGTKGVPDICLIHPKTGQFIGIEAKTEKGKLSEAQESFSDKLIENNAIYTVVRSVNELEADLKEILE